MKDGGVDTGDPLQLLYVLKELGPAGFEALFGSGKPDETWARGREPVIATDVFEFCGSTVAKYRDQFSAFRSRQILKGRRILIASTDVHEHAIMIIHRLLAEAGADMVNLGAEADPDQIVSAAQRSKAEAILISTHNGMALDYARRLKKNMDRRKITLPVVLGGILNQKFENQALPVDVSGDLKKLGFNPCPKLEGNFRKLLESNL